MRRPRTFLVLTFALAIGAVLIAAAGCGDRGVDSSPGAADTLAESEALFDVRSVTLDARTRPDPRLLVRLRDLGVTHLTLVSFGWQRAVDEPRVRVDTSDGWYSESHRGIRALARQADTLGMDLVLKPHIWVGDYEDGHDRSEIGFDTAARWTEWETSYRRFLMHYARLAREVDADVLVLGTELTRSATQRPDFWRRLARDVRTVYDGKLTYAANWNDEYRTIAFWEALDYVGVQAYFPLASESDPSLEELRTRWRSHRAELARVHRRTEKPVLFTEIGYRSAPSAAEAPWRWPEQEEGMSADSTLQARCYRAFLSTMGRIPWFAGAVVWKWHPDTDDQRPTAFTPQGKPAERVLRRWFTSASADSGEAVSPRSSTRTTR